MCILETLKDGDKKSMLGMRTRALLQDVMKTVDELKPAQIEDEQERKSIIADKRTLSALADDAEDDDDADEDDEDNENNEDDEDEEENEGRRYNDQDLAAAISRGKELGIPRDWHPDRGQFPPRHAPVDHAFLRAECRKRCKVMMDYDDITTSMKLKSPMARRRKMSEMEVVGEQDYHKGSKDMIF